MNPMGMAYMIEEIALAVRAIELEVEDEEQYFERHIRGRMERILATAEYDLRELIDSIQDLKAARAEDGGWPRD